MEIKSKRFEFKLNEFELGVVTFDHNYKKWWTISIEIHFAPVYSIVDKRELQGKVQTTKSSARFISANVIMESDAKLLLDFIRNLV